MISRIVSGHNYINKITTYDFYVDLHLYSATHPQKLSDPHVRGEPWFDKRRLRA